MKRIGCLFITSLLFSALFAQKKSSTIYRRGFYLSTMIGPSFGEINAKKNATNIINISGNVIGMDLQIGGTIETNLILHGTIKVQTNIGPVVNSTQFPDSYSFDESFIGVGLTKYTTRNFFGSANVGMALYTFSLPTTSFQSKDVSTDPGLSLNLKIGKEWPVSKKWGLGGALFFSRTALTNRDPNSTEKWSSNRFGICFHAAFNKKKIMSKKKLSTEQCKELLNTLKARFEKNMKRHKGLEWTTIQKKLESAPEKLWSLYVMETTGGEPDVVEYDKKNNEYVFYDCSAESPKGRRSICYDHQALESRKEHKPSNSAIKMAADMGIELLTEEQYRKLQQLGDFDTKTSSWIITPPGIRKLGGAIFCDRRYDTVFVYHNGAESYYGGRAFRGALKV